METKSGDFDDSVNAMLYGNDERWYDICKSELMGDDMPSSQPCVPPRGSPRALYAYLLNSRDIIPNTYDSILDMYSWTHCCYLDYLYSMDEQLKLPSRDMVTSFMKFRHNCFSSIILRSLGEVTSMETDADLTDFGIERTPDFLLERESENYILEFTVANTEQRVLYDKGGGIRVTKYTNEALVMQEITGKIHVVKVLALVLQDPQIDSLSSWPRSLGCDEVLSEVLNKFHCLCVRDLGRINLSNASSSASIHPNEIVNSYQHVQRGVFTRSISERILTFPSNAKDEIEREPVRLDIMHKLTTERFSQCSLVFNTEVGRFSLRRGGLDAGSVRLLFESGDNDELLRLTVDQNGVKLFHVGGTHISVVDRGLQEINKVRFPECSLPICDYRTPRPDPYVGTEYMSDEEDIVQDRVLFEEDYVDRLCSIDPTRAVNLDKQQGGKMMVNNLVNEEMLVDAMDAYKKKLVQSNANYVLSPKSDFILPLTTVHMVDKDYRRDSNSLASSIASLLSSTSPFTSECLRRYAQSRFVKSTSMGNKEIIRIKNELNSISSDYHRTIIQKGYFDQLEGVRRKFWRESRVAEIDQDCHSLIAKKRSKINELKSALSKCSRDMNRKVVRCSSQKKSRLRHLFEEETSTWGKQEAEMRGVGMMARLEYEEYKNLLNSFLDDLTVEGDLSDFELYSKSQGPDNLFFSGAKQHIKDTMEPLIMKLKQTPLFGSSVLVSRLCYSLFKMSLSSCNNQYIEFSNLGFEDVLLMVRGGKKLFSKNTSRMFRLIYPVDMKFASLYSPLNSSHQLVTFGNKSYIITPWSQLHESILETGKALPYSMALHYVSSYTRGACEPLACIRKNIFPVLLAFHNRRQTEKILHNMRYLIVNVLGTYSSLDSILPTFSGFSHTYLQSYIRACIEYEYPLFASKLMEIRDMCPRDFVESCKGLDLRNFITGQPLDTDSDLTEMIYMTYMMTKAPVVSRREQSINMESVLGDLVEFREKGIEEFDILNFDPRCYNNDFSYDPKYCQYLGHFMHLHLRQSIGRQGLNSLWENIMDRPASCIALPTGMRGDKKGGFFNRKGYEVVYTDLYEAMKFEEKVDDVINSGEVETVNSVKGTFREAYRNIDLNKAVFHVVDKIQRAGSREIYVMDYKTKLYQNCLEEYFGKISKIIPNEFISIPSNKRLSSIHSLVFEDLRATWSQTALNFVLDCRRWAPHSVLEKYVCFIEGMSPVLPPTMLKQFYYFFDKMKRKEIHTKKFVKDDLNSNLRTRGLSELLMIDEQAGSAYFIQEFSFVMGIFNYLSSLMHAANQMVAKYCIERSMSGRARMESAAHSDDSVVRLLLEDENDSSNAVAIYDMHLKSANHMFSIKKAMINKNIYLEFLSILYLCSKLLPLIHKFTGSIPFKANDKGYADDISTAMSRSTELLSQGATMAESYMCMRLMAKFIQQLYGIKEPKMDRHYSFLGDIDPHPLQLLIGGSSCELYKHVNYNQESFSKAHYLLLSTGIVGGHSGWENLNWDMGSRKNKRLIELSEKAVGDGWLFRTVKFNNFLLDRNWYFHQLKDPSFYSSAVSENPSKRMARIYGFYNNRSIITASGGRIDANKLDGMISAVNCEEMDQDYSNNITGLQCFLRGLLPEYHETMEVIGDIHYNGTCGANSLTSKPITIDCTYASGQTALSIRSEEAVCIRYFKDMYFLFGKRIDPSHQVRLLDNIIRKTGIDPDELDEESYFRISNKVLGRQFRRYHILGVSPTRGRYYSDPNKMLEYMANNTFFGSRVMLNEVKLRYSLAKWRVMKRHTPEIVLKYIELYWVSQVIEKLSIPRDLLITDVSELLRRLEIDLPPVWKNIVGPFLGEKGCELENYSCWKMWVKRQIRMGGVWHGEGSVFIQLVGFHLEILVSDSRVTEIRASCAGVTSLGHAASWYLENSAIQEWLPQFMERRADVYLPEQRLLGVNKGTGEWCIGLASNMKYGLPIISAMPNRPNCYYSKGDIEWHNGKSYFVSRNIRYRIFTAVNVPKDMKISIKKYIDRERVKRLPTSMRSEFIKTVAIYTDVSYKIAFSTWFDNIKRSLLFHVCSSGGIKTSDVTRQQEDGEFYRALMNYKEKFVEFGFPSRDEIEDFSRRKGKFPIPPRVLNEIRGISMKCLTKKEKELLEDRLRSAFKSQQRERALAQIAQDYGQVSTTQMTYVVYSRDDRLEKSLMSITGRDAGVAAPVISELWEFWAQTIEGNGIYSSILMSHRNQRRVADLFISALTVASYFCTGKGTNFNSLTHLCIGMIVKELCDNGLRSYLIKNCSYTGPVGTVDWDISDERLIQMFMHTVTIGHALNKCRPDFMNGTGVSLKNGSKGEKIKELNSMSSRFLRRIRFPIPLVMVTGKKLINLVPSKLDKSLIMPIVEGLHWFDAREWDEEEMEEYMDAVDMGSNWEDEGLEAPEPTNIPSPDGAIPLYKVGFLDDLTCEILAGNSPWGAVITNGPCNKIMNHPLGCSAHMYSKEARTIEEYISQSSVMIYLWGMGSHCHIKYFRRLRRDEYNLIVSRVEEYRPKIFYNGKFVLLKKMGYRERNEWSSNRKSFWQDMDISKTKEVTTAVKEVSKCVLEGGLAEYRRYSQLLRKNMGDEQKFKINQYLKKMGPSLMSAVIAASQSSFLGEEFLEGLDIRDNEVPRMMNNLVRGFGNISLDDEICLLTDQTLIAEINCLYPMLSDVLMTGKVCLNKNAVRSMELMMKLASSIGPTVHREKVACFAFVLKMLFSVCEIVDNAGGSDWNIGAHLLGLVSDVCEMEEGNSTRQALDLEVLPLQPMVDFDETFEEF